MARSTGEAYTSRGGPTCTNRPSRMMATWSANDSASSWSWVTRSTVAPVAASASATARRVDERSPASSEPNGSSSSTTSGRRARARARATRCCCPPESCSRAPVGQGRRQPDELEQLHRASPVATLGAGQPEADVARHGEVREEVALLGQVADAAPLGRHHRAGSHDGAVTDAHLTGIRRVEPRDHPQQGGLAAPGGAQDGRGGAGLDGQVDAVQHLGAAVGGANPGDDQAGHAITVRWRRRNQVIGADSSTMATAYGAAVP